MNNQDLTKTRKAIGTFLDILGIARVVSIDDIHDKSISVENVIVCAQGLDEDSLRKAFPELESIPDNQDVLAAQIRKTWERLDDAAKMERSRAVIDAVPGHNPDDETYVSILGELIPENRLVSLSPAQWEAQKEQYLRESKEQRTLFLFDQDFSRTGGGSEEGIKIIASLLANGAGDLMCGLLTHTVAPDAQTQQWQYFCEEYNLSQDRFLVISKRLLSENPMIFAQRLKLTALLPHFAELKSKTKKITAEAAEFAANQVEKINIYDLEHIVLRASTEEGLWEPDMLFRLHAMFQRSESRRLAHEGGELEKSAAKLRDVCEASEDTELLPIPSSAWALQREELYESAEYINKNYLPLELGDIFERMDKDGPSRKKYILLAQPCDLMVRRTGKREPELRRIPLAEVVLANEAPRCSEEMPYFGISDKEKWFVKFKLVHFVRACLLDLCVFNQDGEAKLTISKEAPCGIRPAWKKRYERLSKHWRKVVERVDKLVSAVDRQSAAQIKSQLLDDDLFEGSFAETDSGCSITYNCKRIGRLSRIRAMGLLMSYTAILARPAYDRPFVDKTSDSTVKS